MKKIVSSLAALAVLLMPFGAIEALAADSQVEAKTVTAKAGDTDVAVPIEITANAGIVGLALSVEYDAKTLTLNQVEDLAATGFGGKMTLTPSGTYTEMPFNLLFVDELSRDNYTNVGTIAILHFSVAENAADGEYPITLKVDDESTFDVDMDNVAFNAVSGSIVVKSDAAETTTAPAETTTAPVVTTTEAETTVAPVVTTTEAETTAAPVVTTTEAETTAAPVVTTTEAETTTAPIVETTTVSVIETTAAPVVTTTEAETTAAPVVTTTEAETTAAPVVTTTVAETTAAAATYSNAKLAEMAKKDYESKHEGAEVTAEATANADGTVKVVLTGKDGKVVSTYTVDATTGKGQDEKGASVDLPQTGVTGYGAFAAVAGAFAMLGAGAWLTVGVARKKDEE